MFVSARNFVCNGPLTYRLTMFMLNTSVPLGFKSNISCSVFQSLVRSERTLTLLQQIFGKYFLSYNTGKAITVLRSDMCLVNVYTDTYLYLDSLADNLVILISLEPCNKALNVSLSNLKCNKSQAHICPPSGHYDRIITVNKTNM